MKKKTRYLNFYRRHVKTGQIPYVGLCNCLGFDAMEVFQNDESISLYGFTGNPIGGGDNIEDVCHSFTPLRQTMVLFLAAMNNEL